MVRQGRYTRAYHRVVPAAAGAALAGARQGYYMAKAAASKWRKNFRNWRGKSRRSLKRRSWRRSKRFLRSMGVTPVRICTCVFRGEVTKTLSSVASTPLDVCYFSMNDCRDPAKSDSNLTSTWRKTATGFKHMATMYGSWRVIGSIARIRLRPSRLANVAAATSGTSTNTYYNSQSHKVGVVMSKLTSYANEFSQWDEAIMRDDPVKTYTPVVNDPRRGVRFTIKFSPGKWAGRHRGETSDAYEVGNLTISPSIQANACLWFQVADKATAPIITTWEVSWEIQYRVKFFDFNAVESDMIQETVPS